MHIGIDASNLRLGGGITHLSRLLEEAQPLNFGIEKVTIWACQSTADSLPKRPWLEILQPSWVEAGLLKRMFAQQFQLPKELQGASCDLLFSPGGTLPRKLPIPSVTMSQNMLPFEPDEAARFGLFSPMWLKMKLLRIFQGRSFRQADGLIFLTNYAQDAVTQTLGVHFESTALIPHGIERRFLQAPRDQRSLDECTFDQPFRLLYVSIAMPYKHQINVAYAVSALRKMGVALEIQFVGASWGSYGRKLRITLDTLDPEGAFLHWAGGMPFEQLHDTYLKADAFVFASSCENLPNILIEAMAAGLPIASSNRGSMPEVLGEAGVYFDPYSIASIEAVVNAMMEDRQLRSRIAADAWQKASEYSWERCAQDTFGFLRNVALNSGLQGNSKTN